MQIFFYDSQLSNLGKTTEKILVFKMRNTNHCISLYTEEQRGGKIKEGGEIAKLTLPYKILFYPSSSPFPMHKTPHIQVIGNGTETLLSLSLSIPTQSRQAEVEDSCCINSCNEVKSLNKMIHL